MSSSSKTKRSATRVREHFQQTAFSFDSLYDEEGLVQRHLRPGLLRRRDLALSVVASHSSPSVLDVGCGSGRVGEQVLDAGAGTYVGIDFSEPMLELSRERLERFGDRVSLVHGDFLTAPLERVFDVVLALGFFDYLPQPEPFVQRMRDVCSGTLVASFPRWSWFKGPVRKVRYELVNDVRIFNYTEDGLHELLTAAGFGKVEVIRPSRSGLLVKAGV